MPPPKKKSGLWNFVLEISGWMMLHVRGRPVDRGQIEPWSEITQCYITWETATILKISESSDENHLHQLGNVNRFNVWVPHNLSEKSLLDHISTCDSLLKHNENGLFLKQIVMSNEKLKRLWGKWNEPPSATPNEYVLLSIRPAEVSTQ